jgi:Leucine-rich repeat (LRR) protein
LKQLYLFGPEIDKLSDNISNLQNLDCLGILNSTVKQLPVNISKIRHLKKVELINLPYLNQIPEAIFELEKLEELNLENTCIESLSPKLRHLPNLKKINIRNDQISVEKKLAWKTRLEAWKPGIMVEY